MSSDKNFEVRCMSANGMGRTDKMQRQMNEEAKTMNNRGFEAKALSMSGTGQATIQGCMLFEEGEQ